MSRYTLPEPKCRHKKLAFRITAGHPTKTAYASRWVCERDVCVQDAIEWAKASTHQEVRVVTQGEWSPAEAEWDRERTTP